MAKLEAQMAAADIWLEPGQDPQSAVDKLAESMATSEKEKSSVLPRLAEEDLVQFMVKLSVEGFPQAVKVRRMQKYSGTVVRAPEWINESPESPWKPGTAVCAEVARHLGGTGEVLLLQSNCGQMRFQPGDRVTFCLPKASEIGNLPEAKLVMLAQTDRPAGSVLACCRLHLPRPVGDGKQLAPLNLDLHAFSSKVVLSGLTVDVGEAELMRFFSKQGATKGIVAHARGCSFASITFPTCTDVATFVGRSAHAFADDKETRIALLLNRSPNHCHAADEARLPALPAPTIRPGEAPASIFVNWAPLQLALGYVVELRPAGTKAEWAAVDVTGNLGTEQGHFAPSCSSCKVAGLRPGYAYEARVTYVSSCGCRSEASDASQPCAPCEQRIGRSSAGYPMQDVAWPEASPSHGPMMPAPGHHAHAAGPAPMWHGIHGAVPPPPAAPEIWALDEGGFSIAVRWSSVGAMAYVVELREAGSSTVERFVRNASSTPPGAPVELRVAALKPGPGRAYVAQVRSIDHRGCESLPSEAGRSQTMPHLPDVPSSTAGCSPPPWQQVCLVWLPAPAMPSGYGYHHSWSGSTEAAAAAAGLQAPTASASSPVSAPAAKAQDICDKQAVRQELPPEVTGQEESECLILD